MNILHLISSGGMYGAEAVILNLSRVLDGINHGRDHHSILGVFVNSSAPNLQLQAAAARAGIEVHLIHCRGQLDLAVPATLRALVTHVSADVVHAHGYKADVYAAFALRGRHRRPLVSTCHTWYDNDVAVRFYGAVDRWVLRGFDGVVAVSSEVQGRLLSAGVKPEKIGIIRNGVDLRPFLVAGQIRQKGHEGSHGVITPLHFLLIGRLAPEKGVDLFLRAVAHLLQAEPAATAGVRFTVIGEGPDRPALEALRRELGLEDRVALPGHCEDMPGCYAAADVLVSASRLEGLPVAMLEAMASALPVVATAVGEVPQLIKEALTGLLILPGDPASLAAAMLRLLQDDALRESIGAAGQRLIAAEYSAERMAGEYLSLYRSAAASRLLKRPNASPAHIARAEQPGTQPEARSNARLGA